MDNNRNFFITIALSVLILTLWQVFYMNPRIEAEREAAQIEAERTAQQQTTTTGQGASDLPTAQGVPGTPVAQDPDLPGGATPVVPDAGGGLTGLESREEVIASGNRIAITTPRLTGSINLTGARIDDLRLNDYRVSVDDGAPNIELLNPAQRPDGFYTELGFIGTPDIGEVPGPNTVWTVEGTPELSPGAPVTLSFTNEQGLTFQRTISVDNNYMFTFSDQVVNEGGNPVSLSSYGRVTRINTPQIEGFFILHEGLIGVTGTEGLQEIDYSTLQSDRQITPGKSQDGWLGITDKYWAVAMVPPNGQPFQPRYAYFDDGRVRYQADYLSDAVIVAPGQTHTVETQVFAGAKEVHVIDGYEESFGIRQFELLIDWGWFYFITKPMFFLIDFLFRLLGNFGVAILATTVVVKLIFFPLANKSYKSMANMKRVQPKMMEIRDKYADDKMKMQQEMMALYKTEKINPLAGCWPILIQIPVFFALYKVLYVTIEMRHAPFFGWIQDLAAPDPTSIFNLFGLLPYDVPAFLLIGVWPIIMGITMFLQMRMNPTPPDPTQAMIFNWMPVVFTFLLATFPAGLVIYWAWNNFLSILQQGYIMKRQGAKIELWDNLAGMFKRKPKQPAE
jgi:YidC/Oxa1 family membrane protein insertase